MDTLIDQFELEETGRFRAVPSADNVIRILYHHWVLNDDYFPEERHSPPKSPGTVILGYFRVRELQICTIKRRC